ncbi:L,D-transpeptidase [Methylobacterium iners]|uniref:L,D-transpeptidase n=1 Tax=Methylobacterium iners TaxID=418707 RepID=UPI0035A22D5D
MRLVSLPVILAALSTVAFIVPASADVLIKVDKGSQRMTVSVDGQNRFTWPVSTGMTGHDTPEGSFRPFRMEKSHFSKEWDDAPMPNAIFFTERGHAIHGTTQGRKLGRPASHGCIRLSLRNASTLFSIVKAEGMGRTKVVVSGDGLAVATRSGSSFKQARRQNRYDPEGIVSVGSRMSAGIETRYEQPTRHRRSNDTYSYPDFSYGSSYTYDEY